MAPATTTTRTARTSTFHAFMFNPFRDLSRRNGICSFHEDSPRDLEPALYLVILERGIAVELVIEAEPRMLAERKKIPKVECPNIQPCDWVAIELVITSIGGVWSRHAVGRQK